MSVPAQLRTALAGRYEIEREIGAGGMATVYLARDVRHDRAVALKVLNPDLGAILGPERFLAEIKVTANLQHPNLLPLFDSGEAGGLLFYVMPYVEGESLRAQLNREKQLPIDEAVRIGVAVANALEYAHQHGVIHRDLKPENILLQHGQPVVADFGIALAVSNAGGARVTQTGISLGTPQYMSPEQATGDRTIDGRSDVYSLGAVVYEMLAGDPPHVGSTAQSIIAKVITERPAPLRTTRETVTPQIEYAVDRALAKLPADRWSSAREFMDALEGRTVAVAVPTRMRAGTASGRPWLPWSVAAACAALLAVTVLRARSSPHAPSIVRFTIADVGDARAQIQGGTISPDGQTLVIAARDGDSATLWVRRVDELRAHRLSGGDGATSAFFSPDGKWVGFLGLDGNVHKVPLDGGTPTTIGKMTDPAGIVWVTPDTIVTGMPRLSEHAGLVQLSADGSGSSQLTIPTTGMHHNPVATPDGRSVMFTFYHGGVNPATAALASLSTGHVDTLSIPSARGAFPFGMIDDVLLYFDSSSAVWSVPINLSTRRVTGPPARVDPAEEFGNARDLQLARNGTLVYTRGDRWQAVIVVRPTERPDTLLGAAPTEYRDLVMPRWAPDGKAIALVGLRDSGLFVLDTRSRTTTRLTTSRSNIEPVWSADGTRILTTTRAAGDTVAWWQWRDGRHAPERAASTPPGWFFRDAGALSPDGRSLAVQVIQGEHEAVYVSSLGGGGPAPRVVASNATSPEWSPDGKWILYQMDVEGKSQIFAQAFPSGGRVQVTEAGGSHPVWPRGATLYFELGRDIMATDIAETPTGLRVTKTRTYWQGSRASERADRPFRDYDVSPTGDLVVLGLVNSGHSEVVVEVNWVSLLKDRH